MGPCIHVGWQVVGGAVCRREHVRVCRITGDGWGRV